MTIEAYATPIETDSISDFRSVIASELASRAVPPVLEWGPRKHSDAPENLSDQAQDEIDFTD